MNASEDQPPTAGAHPLPGGDFRLFIQKLGYQALITLGVLENPATKTKATNLPHARSVLDDLLMIRDKTDGNLDGDEKEHMDNIIRNLEGHMSKLEKAD